MHFTSPSACRNYVQAELDHLMSLQPGWHFTAPIDVPPQLLTWNLGRDTPVAASWYTLEARFDRAEFLIWFGHHELKVGGLESIMRPAVHLAFAALRTYERPSVDAFSLSDVLQHMIYTLDLPLGFRSLHFEMNTTAGL